MALHLPALHFVLLLLCESNRERAGSPQGSVLHPAVTLYHHSTRTWYSAGADIGLEVGATILTLRITKSHVSANSGISFSQMWMY